MAILSSIEPFARVRGARRSKRGAMFAIADEGYPSSTVARYAVAPRLGSARLAAGDRSRCRRQRKLVDDASVVASRSSGQASTRAGQAALFTDANDSPAASAQQAPKSEPI